MSWFPLTFKHRYRPLSQRKQPGGGRTENLRLTSMQNPTASFTVSSHEGVTAVPVSLSWFSACSCLTLQSLKQLETIRVWDILFTDFEQEIVSENSHTNLSPNMPRPYRESRNFDVRRSKGDDGFYELQLEGGGGQSDPVANLSATSLDPIEDALSPCDGGWRAWAFLASAWMIEAVLWGKSSILLIFSQVLFFNINSAMSSYLYSARFHCIASQVEIFLRL
jgi:hypothetical protein